MSEHTPRYRVRGYNRLERQPRGYVGYHRVYYQDLQRKRWWGCRRIVDRLRRGT